MAQAARPISIQGVQQNGHPAGCEDCRKQSERWIGLGRAPKCQASHCFTKGTAAPTSPTKCSFLFVGAMYGSGQVFAIRSSESAGLLLAKPSWARSSLPPSLVKADSRPRVLKLGHSRKVRACVFRLKKQLDQAKLAERCVEGAAACRCVRYGLSAKQAACIEG